MDLLLTAGDIDFDGQDFGLVSSALEVAQRIRIAFGIHLGEWIGDLREGVDWRGTVLVKAPDLANVRGHLYEVVSAVEGVSLVEELTVSLGSNRILTVNLKVHTQESQVLTGQLDLDPSGSLGSWIELLM